MYVYVPRVVILVPSQTRSFEPAIRFSLHITSLSSRSNMAGASERYDSASIEHSADLETQKKEIAEELKKSLTRGDIW